MGNCMALTFADFLAQAMAQPILFVILVLIIGVTAVSGATDAPNAIATVVSTRCLKPNTATKDFANCSDYYFNRQGFRIGSGSWT